MSGQMTFAADLFTAPDRHKSCKGCCHIYPIYTYDKRTLKEHVEYACALIGVSPKDSPRYARGCPDDMPDRYDRGWK